MALKRGAPEQAPSPRIGVRPPPRSTVRRFQRRLGQKSFVALRRGIDARLMAKVDERVERMVAESQDPVGVMRAQVAGDVPGQQGRQTTL